MHQCFREVTVGWRTGAVKSQYFKKANPQLAQLSPSTFKDSHALLLIFHSWGTQKLFCWQLKRRLWILLYSESRKQVEESVERWRYVLEIREMKASRRKTEEGGRWNSEPARSRDSEDRWVQIPGLKYLRFWLRVTRMDKTIMLIRLSG